MKRLLSLKGDFMDKLIAICGLDCGKCPARIATINDDNELRAKIAKEWSSFNSVEITPKMINCLGCRVDGPKTVFCDKLCPIRQCALKKNYQTCACCEKLDSCEHIKMVTSNNKEALENLKK